MKQLARAVLPPRVYYGLRSLRRAQAQRAERRRRRRFMATIRAGHGDVVQEGPFRGMRYLREVSWGELAPKVLGSYEAELHQELEALVRRGHHRVVNVGSAEGYYAVGLALRLPAAHVFAFDSDPYGQYLTGRLAARNGVRDRVSVEGICTPSRLAEVVRGRTLLVVDCEGCELQLLRPDLVPGLVRADLVVELHDFLNPVISDEVLGRFTESHDAKILDSVARDPGAYPALDSLPFAERHEAVDEHRPGPMQWAVLYARNRSPGSGLSPTDLRHAW